MVMNTIPSVGKAVPHLYLLKKQKRGRMVSRGRHTYLHASIVHKDVDFAKSSNCLVNNLPAEDQLSNTAAY